MFFSLKVVESCVEHIRKPDPEIYKRTLEKLNVKPEDAIFLDDFGQNLKPARDLGIHTIKVRDFLHFPVFFLFLFAWCLYWFRIPK